jgi:transcriptional regulator with XRE-family HTH domain
MLRERIGISQRDLAEKLGTAAETVSRWETGRRTPTRQTLKKLAAIAESARQRRLRDVFESQWKAGILASIENLPSAGTQRRLSLDDLKYWSAYLHQTSRTIQRLHITDNVAAESLRHAAWVMEHIHDDIEVYIDEPRSSARAQEDEQILKSHRPKSTYGLKGEKENHERSKAE